MDEINASLFSKVEEYLKGRTTVEAELNAVVNDKEDGEVSDFDAQNANDQDNKRKKARTASRNKRRKLTKQAMKDRDEERIKLEESAKEMRLAETLETVRKMIAALTGESYVSVHLKFRNGEYLDGFWKAEDICTKPIKANNRAFKKLPTLWIYEPGLHLVFDAETSQFVFGVKIEPLDKMTMERRQRVERLLQTLMDYSTAVTGIKLNASQYRQVHGDEHSTIQRKRYGTMFGAGWHGSMEKDKTLVAYAPKSDKRSIQTYERCIRDLPAVAQLYRDGLLSMFPGGGQQIDSFATDNKIPSFSAVTLDGSDGERPFCNSLTITRDDFANFQHMDNDKVGIAFGLWWAAKRTWKGRHQTFVMDPSIDHEAIKGGAFLNTSYGVGVEFERCEGLVSIYWRGKSDYHGTMRSQSAESVTRFGTSVQLTEKGTLAVNKFWSRGGDPDLAVTPHERVAVGMARLTKVALVEKDDFSAGTSSKSTKLVHGGVRPTQRFSYERSTNYDGSTGQLTGAMVTDTLPGSTSKTQSKPFAVRARGIINATGPFSDTLLTLDNPSHKTIVPPSSGIHITLPNYYSPRKMSLLDSSTSYGRVIFFLPWQLETP
ncbi:hypothetical protein H0H93_002623 [Arthromyces matolae]|nr:hypothetical protein H0H93_002623 [Arthromyces matolae]